MREPIEPCLVTPQTEPDTVEVLPDDPFRSTPNADSPYSQLPLSGPHAEPPFQRTSSLLCGRGGFTLR